MKPFGCIKIRFALNIPVLVHIPFYKLDFAQHGSEDVDDSRGGNPLNVQAFANIISGL